MIDAIILVMLCIVAIVTVLFISFIIRKIICFVYNFFKCKNKKQFISKFIDELFAEWVFDYFPNGGTAVFLRTLVVGTSICIITFCISMYVYSPKSWIDLLKGHIYECLCIYAAIYAAFYARFVSQWTYLSNLYNSIRDQELNCIDKPLSVYIMNERKAEFIYEANKLHLMTKPKFASVIWIWLSNNEEIMKKCIEFDPESGGNPFKAGKNFKKNLNLVLKSYCESG